MGPAPVYESTAKGSTTKYYTPATWDMAGKDKDFYENPTARKFAFTTLIGLAATTVFLGVSR